MPTIPVINPPIRLTWACLPSGRFAALERVILTNVRVGGVYIIWNTGPSGWTIRLGQGDDVASRLEQHRNTPAITRWGVQNELVVTWAELEAAKRDGVERYLAEQLLPREGERYPMTAPIPVNLPWAA